MNIFKNSIKQSPIIALSQKDYNMFKSENCNFEEFDLRVLIIKNLKSTAVIIQSLESVQSFVFLINSKIPKSPLFWLLYVSDSSPYNSISL